MYASIIFGSFIIFVFSEKTFLHFSRTARRIFWYIWCVAVGIWLVQWLQTVEGVGMMWIIMSAVLAASVVEDEMIKKSGLTPLNIEATQRLRKAYRSPEAQGKAELLMDTYKGYTAGTKQLLSRATGTTRRHQKTLHSTLESADEQQLNYILCAINAAALVEVAHRTTIQMLVGPRLPELTTVARAALVDGLQKLGLRYRHNRQVWVRDVIIGTQGLALSHLKAYIDDGGDYHSMYKLMYNDLQGAIQQEVLNHLKTEGENVLEEFSKRLPGGPPGAVLKVLSDIDDTLFSSGGSFPAGVDARYPRKCYYPGALAFYAELDRCFAKRYGRYISAMAGIAESKSQAGSPQSVRGGFRFQDRSDSLTDDASSPPPTAPLPAVAPPPYRGNMLGDLVTPRDMQADVGTVMSPRQEIPADDKVLRAPYLHHQEGSNLVFLSARPESYKGFTESESYRKYFQPLVARGDLDTSPTMLLGSLDSGPKALYKMAKRWLWIHASPEVPDTAIAALYQTLAAKKLSRFREYAAIYPEAAFVLVGDNGQGDVLCAELLWSSIKQTSFSQDSLLMSSFIHKVVPEASTLSMLHTTKGKKEDWLSSWEQRNIFFHNSHVGMAVKAFHMQLLEAESLYKVAIAARDDYRRVYARYGVRHSGRHLSKALHHLNDDIAAANVVLPEHLRVPVLRISALEGPLPSDDGSKLTSAPSEALSDVTSLQPMH